MKSKFERDLIVKVLSVMKEKGVREDLLVGLSEDEGFAKFGTEWISQEGYEESKISEAKKITKLNQIIKSKQAEINTMRIPYRATIDKFVAENEKMIENAAVNQASRNLKFGFTNLRTQGILRLNADKYNSLEFIKAIDNLNDSHWNANYLFILKRKQKETNGMLKKSALIKVEKLKLINNDTRLSRAAIIKIGYYYKDLLGILPRTTKSVLIK